MPFKKGQSGNPKGSYRKLEPEVRAQIKANAAQGVERLRQILEDDKAFGPKGWLSGKEQIAVAALAMDRAYGKSTAVEVSHTHAGTIGMKVSTDKMKSIAEKLPERIAQQRTVEDAEYTEVEGLLEEREDD